MTKPKTWDDDNDEEEQLEPRVNIIYANHFYAWCKQKIGWSSFQDTREGLQRSDEFKQKSENLLTGSVTVLIIWLSSFRSLLSRSLCCKGSDPKMCVSLSLNVLAMWSQSFFFTSLPRKLYNWMPSRFNHASQHVLLEHFSSECVVSSLFIDVQWINIVRISSSSYFFLYALLKTASNKHLTRIFLVFVRTE